MSTNDTIYALYKSVVDLDAWDFIKTCDPDDYADRRLQAIAWEFGKYGVDCSGEDWHIAMDHLKSMADNYITNYK